MTAHWATAGPEPEPGFNPADVADYLGMPDCEPAFAPDPTIRTVPSIDEWTDMTTPVPLPERIRTVARDLSRHVTGDADTELLGAAFTLGVISTDVENELAAANSARDGAYRERAHLLAWLTTAYPAVIADAPDVDEPGWQIVYITAPTGQLTWHIHPHDAVLFTHVEHVTPDDPRAKWDGHTTAQKYTRIRREVRRATAGEAGK